LYLLNEGYKGKINVYTIAGTKLDKNYLVQVKEDIVKKQFPWRAEWCEDKIIPEDGKLKINNNYIFVKNEKEILIPQYSEFLNDDTLMKKRSLIMFFIQKENKSRISNFKNKIGKFALFIFKLGRSH